MSQLSFFSAESVPPAVADLTGILAAPGQVVLVGSENGLAARLSVVVDRLWRAEALAEMIAEAGLQPEIARTDENTPLVRTTVEPRLVHIAREWTLGAVKTVPPQWLPGPRELRAWTLASGTPEADRYLLGLDPHAPDTHAALASAMMRIGIAPTLIGTRGSHPALRISGRRRLSRLVENVGEPPGNVEAFEQWPSIRRAAPGGSVCVGSPGVRNCQLPGGPESSEALYILGPWQQEKWSVGRGGRRGPQQRPQWKRATARNCRVAY